MSRYSHPVLVRWSDIDSYDHVNNVRYFDYLQEGRMAFLSELLGAGFLHRYPVVMASQTVDYLRPMLLRHPPYAVDLWLTAIGTTSYTFGSEITDADTVYARASTVLVAVDPQAQGKRELSAVERDALSGYLV